MPNHINMKNREIRPMEWMALVALVVLLGIGAMAPAESVGCERFGVDAHCFELADRG